MNLEGDLDLTLDENIDLNEMYGIPLEALFVEEWLTIEIYDHRF